MLEQALTQVEFFLAFGAGIITGFIEGLGLDPVGVILTVLVLIGSLTVIRWTIQFIIQAVYVLITSVIFLALFMVVATLIANAG